MTIHKGIDDLLAAGGTPKRLEGEQVDEFFERLRKIHEDEAPETKPDDVQTDPTEVVRPVFPVEVFPAPVRFFVEQVAKATGCPPDFPGVAALVVAGASIGAARAICLKEGWNEQPGMYAAIVAKPGRVKTPALKAVMKPIHEEQDRLYQNHLAAAKKYLADLDAYKKSQKHGFGEIDDILSEPSCAPTKPPAMRHVFTSDTTVEALAVNLWANPKGLLIFRDEFTAWVQSMNQYRRGGADRQFYLSAWSNEMVIIDRKNLEGPLIIRFPFLSALGGVQPDMLSSLEAKGGAEDGFMDRLLFAYPEEQPFQGWIETELEEETQHEWQMSLGRLLALEPNQPEGASYTPRVIHLDQEGKSAFKAFFDQLAEEMNTANLSPRLVGVFSKLRAYTARFALVIHLLRWAAGEFEESWGEGCVDAEDVRRAVLLCDYFKGHAMAVHGCLMQSAEDKRVDALLAWMERKCLSEVRPRDIVRANVAGINKASDARNLMEAAADRGYGNFENTGVQKRSAIFIMNQGPKNASTNQTGTQA